MMFARLGESLIAVALALGPVPGARADVPLPENDPFFAVPAGIAGLPNGTVLSSRPVTASSFGIPLPARAWQIKYKTLDQQDTPTATVTTVMVPNAPWSRTGLRPFVSYQTAEDGVGSKCAPSYALTKRLHAAVANGQSEAQTLEMAEALTRGWTVAVPDYEGPRSQFLGDNAEAHGVLDGIRAARGFKPAGIAPNARYGLMGYSGGALASAFAAQLQPAYAPELSLSGIALGGVVASYKLTIEAFSGGLEGGALITGLVGLNRSYPEQQILQYLNAVGRQDVGASQSDCISDDVSRYPLLSMAQIEARPDVLDDPGFTAFLARHSPVAFAGTPTAPVYDYHATGDELAPIGPDRQLIARYCAAGVPVEHVEQPVGEHLTAPPIGFPGALAYLSNRFAGRAAPNTCPARATHPTTPAVPKLTLTVIWVTTSGRVLTVRLRLSAPARMSFVARSGRRTVAAAKGRSVQAGTRTLHVTLNWPLHRGNTYTIRITARRGHQLVTRFNTANARRAVRGAV